MNSDTRPRLIGTASESLEDVIRSVIDAAKASKRHFRDRYTRRVKQFDKHAVFLVIDHQSFCVAEDVNKPRAEWYRRNLAAALERLVENESGGAK